MLIIINEFSKATGSKINTHQLVVFPCTNNEQPKGEVKGKHPITKNHKEGKCLGIKLTMNVRELHTETPKLQNSETFICRNTVCSWERRHDTRISILNLKIKRGWGWSWKYG